MASRSNAVNPTQESNPADEARRRAAEKSRARCARLRAEGRCYRCGHSSDTPRCQSCAKRDSSVERMRRLRASESDTDRERHRQYHRDYYANKRSDARWRAAKWERNAVNAIKRQFNFEGGEEWAEAANLVRKIRGTLNGRTGRPRLRVAPLSRSAECEQRPTSKK